MNAILSWLLNAVRILAGPVEAKAEEPKSPKPDCKGLWVEDMLK